MKNLSEKELLEICIKELAIMTGQREDSIDINQSFEEMRLNSIHAMQLLDELEDLAGISISPITFWENPTLAQFCKFIAVTIKSGHS